MERGNDFQHGLADGDPQLGQLAENREDRLVLFEQIDAHLIGGSHGRECIQRPAHLRNGHGESAGREVHENASEFQQLT